MLEQERDVIDTVRPCPPSDAVDSVVRSREDMTARRTDAGFFLGVDRLPTQ